MSRNVSLVVACAVTVLLNTLPASGQGKKSQDPPGGSAPIRPRFSHHIKLPANDELEARLEAAGEYLRAREYGRAVLALQSVLDAPDDCFVAVLRPGAIAPGWVSARAEANRLLGAMPPDGIETYERVSGAAAAALLSEARKKGDLAQVGRVALRYLHTRAGAAAADQIGTHHLDRGQHATAARWFGRLLERPDKATLKPLTLFKATLAFRRAGDVARADLAWTQLKRAAPGGLEIGGRTLTLAELNRELTRVAPLARQDQAAHEWLVFRGGESRNAHGAPLASLAPPRWREKTTATDTSLSWVESAAAAQRGRGGPLLGGQAPLLVAGAVIYRDHGGVAARDRATGELLWRQNLDSSLDTIAGNAHEAPHLSSWMQNFLQTAPHMVVENSCVGQLSSDRRLVFAVEDLAVPPFPANYGAYSNRGGNMNLAFAPEMTHHVYHSRLLALDLDGGRVVWQAGGSLKPARGEEGQPPVLAKCHFLGAPLPVAGKLYCLVESEGSLVLVCLEAARGKLLWSQTLGTPRTNVILAGSRRSWAAHPAHAEGVLVCSTNSGAVIAVDLAGQGLLWAHSYRDDPPPEQPMPLGARPIRRFPPANQTMDTTVTWKLTAPVIQNGKVIVASPDSKAIDCFDLWSGAALWRQDRREEDLYVAGVIGGRVVVVGRGEVRAHSIKDGSLLWQAAVASPTGQGVVSGNRYYLPVGISDRDAGPSIQIIDLEKGAVVGRVASPNGEELGNLVSVGGDVISQTPLTVTVYPQQAPRK